MTAAEELPVDVWIWDLDIDDRLAQALSECLSEDEKTRAARFSTAVLRHRWIAGRAGMRGVLASALGQSPAAPVFGAGEHGRPFLARPDCPFSFNLSHSANLAAFAICGATVGIDVEEIRRLPEGVARMMFSEAEIAALEAEPLEKKAEAFFRYWTAKEAILKALGSGLSVSGRSFTVDISIAGTPRLVDADWKDHAASPWRLQAFAPVAGFSAAVAVQTSRPLRLNLRRWILKV